MIARLLDRRGERPPWVTVDAGDDCAVVHGATALKVDTLVEGTHFDARTPDEAVGYKVVAVCVSDLGAAGARPEWLMLSLTLPRVAGVEHRADAIARGVSEACDAFGVYLVGGDVTGSGADGRAMLSASMGGTCVATPRRRSGARPGDLLWVTGTPGLAGMGWMHDDPPPEALAALHRPSPPLAFALASACRGLATAAMDLSDGLASDVPRLAGASGVRVVVDPGCLPLHDLLRDDPHARRYAMCGGDDYELLFTTDPADARAVLALGEEHGVRVTAIGVVERGEGVSLVGGTWPRPAFEHFEADPPPEPERG
ncbi:MAG: thiamine-phosphate kinase [Alphaproteobacteria bacterium]|nr:thiamine-phosphate kinase [Alphaproteobacteria bacterium]MCB9697898.1 thiamine-phosphate kinase [Alphaproteobacteria bacterium]